MPRHPNPPPPIIDVPATVPAVITPRRADWSEWSAERERKRLEAEIKERARVIDQPIYPREIAAKLADDAARSIVPDWRLLREDHRALFVQLLRQQPELQQREVKQLDSLLRLIGDQLPAAMRPLLTDYRTILELRILAHETAAFLVGIESGKRLARQHVDSRGRVRSHRHEPTAAFRLHAGDPDAEP